jgi:RimJ/RimL family protein N-acetyltransferase
MNYKPELFHSKPATDSDLDLVKAWWNKEHVKPFWDNSPEMWQNCENYLKGHKDIFDYWIGYYDNQAFCLFMTSFMDLKAPSVYFPYYAKSGDTWSIDFMIGNENFLGKGFSHFALREFINKLPTQVKAILIDPDCTNENAVKAYKKAGFEIVGDFMPSEGEFIQKKHYMMRIMR